MGQEAEQAEVKLSSIAFWESEQHMNILWAWFALLVAGFICFVYLWVALIKMWRGESLRLRERISLYALVLVSGIVALRFVMPFFWGPDIESCLHVAFLCTQVSVKLCVLALVLGLVGRPLRPASAVTRLATAAFWVASTAP